MKFTVNSTDLLKQLSAINGAIVNNPVIPILDNFLFDIRDGILHATASDLQTSMITEIAVDTEANASICIPAKILLETLRNLPQQPVHFLVDLETFAIEIQSENGRYKLAGENAIDFPKIPSSVKGDTITLSSSILEKAISNTIFCTGTDDLRPAMTGIYVNLTDTNATFVATDGHRLVRYRRSDVALADAETSIIIPRKALTLVKAALPQEDSSVTVSFTASNAFFSIGPTQLICRLIDERYPDYEAAIPVSSPFSLVINRLELLNSLKRISIYANKTTHQVRFKVAATELTVSAEDLDFSNEASETLTCEFDGDPLEIGFNAKFLVEMLSNLESNLITIELTAPNRQGILLPNKKAENEDILMLVMPVMLNHYV